MSDDVETASQALLWAVAERDDAAVGAAFDRLGELHGAQVAETLKRLLPDSANQQAFIAALERLASRGQDAHAWANLSAAELVLGGVERALAAAVRARDCNPASFEAALMLCASARAQPERVLDTVADLARHDSAAAAHPEMLLHAATAELALGRFDAALVRLDAGLDAAGRAGYAGRVQYNRGAALVALARHGDAAVAFERALKLAPDARSADLARDGLVRSLSAQSKWADALPQLDAALAATADPAYRLAWLGLKVAALASLGRFDEALALLDELHDQAPDDSTRRLFRLAQARTCADGARFDDAARHFDALIESTGAEAPDRDQQQHSLRLEKAQRLSVRAIDRVLTDLDWLDRQAAAQAWPGSCDLRVAGLIAAGRHADAAAWLDALHESAPARAAHPAWQQARGEVHMKAGELDGVERCCREALARAQAGTDARGWGAALTSAVFLQRPDDILLAGARLREIDPGFVADPQVRTLLALAHLRRGELDRAIELTDEPAPPVRLLPTTRLMRAQVRGDALLQRERTDEALAALQDGIAQQALVPADAVTLATLQVLQVMRARVHLKRGAHELARDAATAAIELGGGADPMGLGSINLSGAHALRAMAEIKLGQPEAARRDAVRAIEVHAGLTNSAGFSAMARLVDTDEMRNAESSLWFTLGHVYQEDERAEESLAAYARAHRHERRGNRAAVAHGYALARTGAMKAALDVFVQAQAAAVTADDRTQGYAGQGWALLRLGRHEEAVEALQAALDARVTEPEDDPAVFEWLGLAYDALGRRGAACRAFRTAWRLTAVDKRSVNLARGVSAGELRLNRAQEALDFLDREVQAEAAGHRSLLLNRALALDALGRRAQAIDCLRRARSAGLDAARQELERLVDAPSGIGRWTQHWFGAEASRLRRWTGGALLVVAASALAAPWLQWSIEHKVEWTLLLLPAAAALAVLALPNVKSIGGEAFGLKLSAEPIGANTREAAAVALPAGFELAPGIVFATVAPGGSVGP